MKRYIMRMCCLFLGLLFVFSSNLNAEIWDYDCERAIKKLRDAQQEVASAYDDLESTKSNLEYARIQYNYCTPSEWNDCEYERDQLNYAIDRYNEALENLNYSIDEFYACIQRLSRTCLY